MSVVFACHQVIGNGWLCGRAFAQGDDIPPAQVADVDELRGDKKYCRNIVGSEYGVCKAVIVAVAVIKGNEHRGAGRNFLPVDAPDKLGFRNDPAVLAQPPDLAFKP